MMNEPYRRFDAWVDSGDEWYADPLRFGFLAFAFQSYDQAQEKCHEFNRIHSDERFRGRVLRSVSNIYQATCVTMGCTPLDMVGAAGAGYGSFFEAICGHDPSVYQEMQKARDALWEDPRNPGTSIMDPITTVFFTVHKVVQSWGYAELPRAWHHPDFEAARNNPAHLSQLARELKISRLIYDEVSHQDLVHVVPAQDVAWCKEVAKAAGGWDNAKLPQKMKAWASTDRAAGRNLSFSDCNGTISTRFKSTSLREVSVDAVPFGNDADQTGLYRRQDGRQFYVQQQRWWQSLGANLVILTTESIPTNIAKSLRWLEPKVINGEEKQVEQRFQVFELDDVKDFIHEPVPVCLDNRAARDRHMDTENEDRRISSLITDLWAHDPELHIISDNLARLQDSRITTHNKARGSNTLQEHDLATVLQYLSPDVYARLCLLHAEFRIEDVVTDYYRDMLFQSIGRNRGYRRDLQFPTEHNVLMSSRLYSQLGKGDFTAGFRYELFLTKPFWN